MEDLNMNSPRTPIELSDSDEEDQPSIPELQDNMPSDSPQEYGEPPLMKRP